MRYNQTKDRIEGSKNSNANALERLSSQRDITKLSDDPVGVTQIIRNRDKISTLGQYQKNIEYSKGFLERSEAALGGLTDSLIRAKELAVAMSNDTYAQTSREATAREIRELMDEMTQMGNMTFNGRFVFGGFRNQTPPLNLEGDFLGDDGVIHIPVSQDNFRPINLQARHLFEADPAEREAGHYNMMQTMEILFQGLQDNDKNMIHEALDELDFQLEKTSGYQATLGSMWNSLEGSMGRLEKEEDLARETLSNIQDADIFEATSEFKRTETVLQSTLMASTKLLQPSLLNFMQ